MGLFIKTIAWCLLVGSVIALIAHFPVLGLICAGLTGVWLLAVTREG